MARTKAIILITGIILVTLIPCLVTQNPDDDDEGGIHQESSSESRGHNQNEGDLEGPYTFNNRGHHGRKDRKSGGSRHGERKSEHRSSHEHRGRAPSSKEFAGNTGSSNRGHCQSGSFMNRSSGHCVICSSCPINQIIRRPCSAHRDTVCGPFYEFQQQQHSKFPPQNDQGDKVPKGSAAAAANSGSGPVSAETGAKKQSKKFETGGSDGDEAPHAKNTEDDGVGQTRGPTVQSSADQWRELCYGLIGALAVVTLLALIYIIITQIQARRHSAKYPDVHCRTVLTPTMRVFANGFLGTTDYQKITPQFDDSASRRPKNWVMRHLKRSLASHSQPNQYVMDGEVVLPLGAMPEIVEMDRIQEVPQPPPGAQAQEHGAQGQAAQGHAAQAHRLESTQSWDSGIGTQEMHRQA